MTNEPPHDNLTLLRTKPDEFQAHAEQLRRELGALVDLSVDIAKARKALYDAYVAAGFTETQALGMCQKLTY